MTVWGFCMEVQGLNTIPWDLYDTLVAYYDGPGHF